MLAAASARCPASVTRPSSWHTADRCVLKGMNCKPLCSNNTSLPISSLDLFDQSFRLRIAIMIRIAEQLAIAIQQPEINTPRIDAERLRGCSPLERRSRIACLHLMQQPQNIPVQMIADLDRMIGKAMNFRHLQASAAPSRPLQQLADQRPSAARAQIKRQYVSAAAIIHVCLPPPCRPVSTLYFIFCSSSNTVRFALQRSDLLDILPPSAPSAL